MVEFNIRTDSVDVEQIMRQIRARIKEKRGVDYSEQQIQELANVKLQRFLDPKGVRSDLVEQFKRTRGVSPEPPNYSFEDTTLYDTHRGLVRFIRKLLNPILKLFLNPNPIVHVLHLQGQINNINAQQFRVREELDALYYEVIHNLVLEVTRLGIESKNLKMRLESLSSRMDFDERRARALEGAVQYKTGTGPAREAQATAPAMREVAAQRYPERPAQSVQGRAETGGGRSVADAGASAQMTEGLAAAGSPATASDSMSPLAAGTARRRRRRRRGRRGGKGRGPGDDAMLAATPPHGDATGDAALDSEAVGNAAHQAQREYYDSESDGSESTPDGQDSSEPSGRDPEQ